MKTVNLLFIGNSYSRNLETFMPIIAKRYGINLNICNVYYGGCSTSRHVNYIRDNEPAYELDTFDFAKNKWNHAVNKRFTDVIKLAKWDYVSLQQCSIYSGYDDDNVWDSLSILKSAVSKLLKPYSPNFKFIWHMTWCYAPFYPLPNSNNAKLFTKFYRDWAKMDFDIQNTYRHRILPDKDFVKTLPSGELLDYVRHFVDSSLVYTPDGIHLQDKWGCFIIGIAALKTLFNIDIKKLDFSHYQLLKYSINNQQKILSFNKEEFELILKILKIYYE